MIAITTSTAAITKFKAAAPSHPATATSTPLTATRTANLRVRRMGPPSPHGIVKAYRP